MGCVGLILGLCAAQGYVGYKGIAGLLWAIMGYAHRSASSSSRIVLHEQHSLR